MVEPEVAYLDFNGLIDLIQDYLEYVVQTTVERCKGELEILERDTSSLLNVKKPFPIISYTEAVQIVKKHGVEIQDGDDFGAPQEEALVKEFNKPVLVTGFPSSIKAFYMKPNPQNPEYALCVDVISPEGFGELIGGSERIADYDFLVKRINEHNLPVEAFKWYLDLRKFGSVPHSGFGMGIERMLSWLSGVRHIRECIPFPRMLYKIYP